MIKGKGIYELIKEGYITEDNYKELTLEDLNKYLKDIFEYRQDNQSRITGFINGKGEKLN